MNTLCNYIGEALLKRTSSINKEIVMDELKRYSYDCMGEHDKNASPWSSEGGVVWNNVAGGIVIDDKRSTLGFMNIPGPVPPPFNIVSINVDEMYVIYNDMVTTKGMFASDCAVKNINELSINYNKHLLRLEDLPQKVHKFIYGFGEDAWKETDIDGLLDGMPRWCDKIELNLARSQFVKNFFNEKKASGSSLSPMTLRTELDGMIYEKIEARLDPGCPAAKYRGNTEIYYTH